MQIWGINIRVSKNYAQYCFFSQCSSVIVFSIHWRRHSVASILYTRRIHRRGDWIYSTVASFSVIQAIVFFIQAVFTWGVNIFYSSKLFCDCHFLVIHWATTYQIHPTSGFAIFWDEWVTKDTLQVRKRKWKNENTKITYGLIWWAVVL